MKGFLIKGILELGQIGLYWVAYVNQFCAILKVVHNILANFSWNFDPILGQGGIGCFLTDLFSARDALHGGGG